MTTHTMPSRRGPSRRALLGAALGAPLAAPSLSACSSASASPGTLRLGYFANLTHGVALAGVARGTYARHLAGAHVEPQIFDSGPSAVQALLAGALDIAYLGPGPAVTAWVRTKGKGVRLIAGAATNGAALVTRPEIGSVEALRGRSVSTPQLGGTQDVALKTLLMRRGISTGAGSNQAEVLWMPNSQTLEQFKQGRLDASYQAEPWVSRLVVEAGAHVLVDETSQWPAHAFSTTCALVSQDYLRRCPRQVEQFLAAHVEATRWILDDQQQASRVINAQIERLTGKKLKRAVIQRAMKNVTFSWDPLMSNVAEVARHAWETRAVDAEPDPHGMADLSPLNRVLSAQHLPQVDDGGYAVKEER